MVDAATSWKRKAMVVAMIWFYLEESDERLLYICTDSYTERYLQSDFAMAADGTKLVGSANEMRE